MLTNPDRFPVLLVIVVASITVLISVSTLTASIYFYNNQSTQMVKNDTVNQKRLGAIEEKLGQIVQLQKNLKNVQQQVVLLKNSSSDKEQASTWLENQAEADEALAENPGRHEEFMKMEEQLSLKRDALIEETFVMEELDQEWSNGMTTKISDAFQTPQLSVGQLVQAECRSTMCLVEFDFDPTINQVDDASGGNAAPASMFENEVIFALNQDLPTGTIKKTANGDGGFRYSIYFAKKGHLLPEP